MTTDLDGLIDAFIADEVEEWPVRATSLGIDGHDERLGDFTAAGFSRRERKDEKWLAHFSAIADEGLSLDQRLDRDLIVSTLNGRRVAREWAGSRRDPATYLGPALGGVFTLFLHRSHPEPDLARFAAARLRSVPELLAAAKENLDADLANQLIVERAAGQCRAGVAYARNLVPAEVSDDGLRADLAEAGEVAAAAFENFAAFLGKLQADAAGTYAYGENLYSRMLRERELLGYGADEMRSRGRAAYEELDAEMTELAACIDPGKSWREVLRDLDEDFPETPEAIRAAYEASTEEARQFLHDRGLVTMPDGEQCLVEPSPPFQRPVLAVASYSMPPAFKPSRIGHFFVPFPPDGTPADDVRKRMQANNHTSIPTIAVHEAYPGHHWHLVHLQDDPRPIRRILGTSYFTEGWALYAERLIREEGFFTDPRHELCHLDARIFRAARIIVDTSLHIGDMSFDEAVDFMSTKTGLSGPTVNAEVGRYCTWPTQASSYLTGTLEIERIRANYFDAGKGNLRTFNDTIAGSGMLPIELAERAVMES